MDNVFSQCPASRMQNPGPYELTDYRQASARELNVMRQNGYTRDDQYRLALQKTDTSRLQGDLESKYLCHPGQCIHTNSLRTTKSEMDEVRKLHDDHRAGKLTHKPVTCKYMPSYSAVSAYDEPLFKN